MTAKQIPVPSGHAVLVDETDLRALRFYHWRVHKTMSGRIYAATRNRFTGKILYMHRFLMKAPAGSDVDHIDGDGLNNQRSNLRLCSRKENVRNSRPQVGRSSRFKGVHLCPDSGRWHARIVVDGKKVHLGRFTREGEAAAAYNKAARIHFGQFARVNSLKIKA